MLRILVVVFYLFFTILSSQAQLNTELVAHFPYSQNANDIWGWVSEDGTEYALVGLRNGISIVSLANPNQPVEVAYIPGPNSIWRDLKTWGDYAYVTHDNTRDEPIGVHIINLSFLPDSVVVTNWMPDLENLGRLSRCHNLYIDEFGVAYFSGCDVNNGGIIFADVATEPGQPKYLGKASSRYSHDAYAKDNLLFSSDIYDGNLTIFDVSDKSNPILLASQRTPFAFTHNAWATPDNKYVFTTDERANAPVTAYDISDLENIQLLDEFRPQATLNQGVIPHNVHVIDNYLAISHYTDGLVIVDASYPKILVEVANYDTFTGQSGGFNGAWGAYPFLPSGLVLVTDITNGLFVVRPQYKRASFLEGKVTDAITGEVIANVRIFIKKEETQTISTNLKGEFSTGFEAEGNYTVTFIAEGYISQTVQVVLESGNIKILNIALESRLTTTQDIDNSLFSLQIAPNPFQHTTFITVNSENQHLPFTISIRNILGQTLLKVKNNQLTIQENDLPKGFYVVDVELDNRLVARQKMVKE
jgi:choice-of-anchor B domain-containing protein